MKANSSPKTILITGCSRGIGRALSLEFARLGHTVQGCARSDPALDELRKLLPAPHRFTRVDVTDRDQVRSWADGLLASAGPPDLLLNNAAVINRNAPLIDVPPEEFEAVIDVNIKGVFHVLQAFLPAMIRRGSGVLVNFSSGWGRSTSPEVAPYCASKWAIEGLTQALAQELPRGLAAIPVSPNVVHTDMLRSCFGSEDAAQCPDPENWAKVCAPWFLGLGPAQNG